jgi:hypothetical protein
VGGGAARRRHALEHPGFPRHPFEVVPQGVFHLALRLGPPAGDEFQEESDQAIRPCSTAEQAGGGEEGQPAGHTMPTEFLGGCDRAPWAVRLQDGRGAVLTQGRRELAGPEAFQFGDVLGEVVQGRPPGVGPQFLEQGACEGGGGVRVGGRRCSRTSKSFPLPLRRRGQPRP